MHTHLHIDPFAGIAGDMFLGALIHAGLKLDDLRDALAALELEEPFALSAEPALRQGIAGIDFKVNVGEDAARAIASAAADAAARFDATRQHAASPQQAHAHDHDQAADGAHHHHSRAHTHSHKQGDDGHAHGHAGAHTHIHKYSHAHHHHHVHYADMLALVDRLKTTSRGRQRARRIIDKLAHAEAAVHANPVEQVHFHEVGAVDSIVDMLGAAAGLEILGIDTLSCGAMPISRGFVRCEHGKMPVPAPATAYLLRDMPTYGIDRNLEMITPTGAAIAAALCESFGSPPVMTLRTIGYGAGDRDDADLPNLLRVFIGGRR